MPLLKEIREDIKVQNTIIEDDIFYDETDDLNENLNLGAYEIDEEKNKNKITNESKEKKKDDTVIAFHSKERGLSETAEYHLYISTLLQEFVKLKIEKEDPSLCPVCGNTHVEAKDSFYCPNCHSKYVVIDKDHIKKIWIKRLWR